MELRLYVWLGILHDYTSGIAFALAPDVDTARELIVAQEFTPLRSKEENLEMYLKWRADGSKPDWYTSSALWRDLAQEPEVHEAPYGMYVEGGG